MILWFFVMSFGYCLEVNPKVFFLPELEYIKRKNTGIIILGLKKREMPVTINNPFFHKANQYDDNFIPSNEYRVDFADITYLPDTKGKIYLQNLKPLRHQLRLNGQTLEINLALGETKLILWLDHRLQNNTISLIGIDGLQILENQEFNALQKKITKLSKIMLDVQNLSYPKETLIDADYRDQRGKKDDFVAYLNFLQSHIQNLSFAQAIFYFQANAIEAQLEGKVTWLEHQIEDFHTTLQLNGEQKIIRHQTDLKKPFPPLADAKGAKK